MGRSTEMPLEAMVHLIDSLIHSGQVYLHQINATSETEYVQLSEKVTIGYLKFKRAVEVKDSYVDPFNEFNQFIRLLMNSAALNHWYHPNAEKAHAEYLIGFLLHHNIKLTYKNDTYLLNSLIWNKMSSLEKDVMTVDDPAQYPGHHYFFEAHKVPPEYYSFLSETWREAQNYPTIEMQYTAWQHLQATRAYEAELERQIELEKAAQERAYQQWRSEHYFDTVLMTYENFSYMIEGYVLSGGAGLLGAWSHNSRPSFSQVDTQNMLTFSQIARANNLSGLEQLYLAWGFEVTLGSVFENAKYDLSTSGQAARLFTSFLLKYNIQVLHEGSITGMRDLYWKLSSPMDQYRMQSGFAPHPHDAHFLTNLSRIPNPSKKDIEAALNQQYPRPYLNQFHNHHGSSQPVLQTTHSTPAITPLNLRRLSLQ